MIVGVDRPIAIGGGKSASVGAAVFEGARMSKQELIRRADDAMHRAKQQGHNTYRFFRDEGGA